MDEDLSGHTLFMISEMAGPIVLNFGVWLRTR